MLIQLYKKKQGQILRWGTFGIASTLFLYGIYQLYFFLSQWEWATKTRWFWFSIPLLGGQVVFDPRFLISLVSAIFFVWLFFYLCFQRERISDFLIDTESEMRKVSWPTFGEVVKSSIAVILIVFILGIYLYLVDGVLSNLLKFIL